MRITNLFSISYILFYATWNTLIPAPAAAQAAASRCIYLYPFLPHRAEHDGLFRDVVGAWVSCGPMLLAVSQLPGMCDGLWVAAVSLPVT